VSRRARALLAAVLALAWGAGTREVRAEGATRASLVWILGDDASSGRPGETTPPSAAVSIGDRPGYDGLFEGLSSRYTGRENRLELRLAGDAAGIHPALVTRAELALGIDAASLGDREGTLRFEDAGSQIELFWRFSSRADRTADGAGFRLYPLDGDRERLGELEALGVGGEVGPARESPYASARGPVRAGRFWLELFGVRGFLVLKTAAFVEPLPAAPATEETSYALFGGVETHWRRLAAFGLGLGHFEHGRLPSTGGPTPRATTTAASARLSIGRGLSAPLAPASFGNEPPPFDAPRTEASGATGWALGVEGSHIVQRLLQFEQPDRTALAGARAFAALGTLRTSAFELRAAAIARDAGFVVRNAPGIFPGRTTPRGAFEIAELSALVSAGLTPLRALSLIVASGIRRPAALLTQAFDRSGQPSGATALLGGAGEGTLLPAGELPVPIFDLRPSVELRVSRLLEVQAWASYRRDFNRTRLVPDATGAYARAFADPDRIGYGIAARAVW
jgi:hypothetical protein